MMNTKKFLVAASFLAQLFCIVVPYDSKATTIKDNYSYSGQVHYLYQPAITLPATGITVSGKYENDTASFSIVAKAGYAAKITITYDSVGSSSSGGYMCVRNPSSDWSAQYSVGQSYVRVVNSSITLEVGAVATQTYSGSSVKEMRCNFTIKVVYEALAPNLTVSALNLSSKEIAVGESATLSYTVSNVSGKDAAAFNVYVYDGTQRIAAGNESALSGGCSVSKSIALSGLSAGTHTITVVTDATDLIEETDESDNQASVVLNVYKSGASYTVCFDANGGAGSMPDQTFKCGIKQTLSANQFVYDGKLFMGWATSVAGAVIYDDAQEVCSLTYEPNARITLYAVWKTDVVYVVPENITSIGKDAFRKNYDITSVVIHDNVTNIGEYAFYDCTNLVRVTIGTGVRSIGEEAFGFCYNLKNITVPGNVKKIGSRAFYSCQGLRSVILKDGVEDIGYWAFGACYRLSYLVMPDSVENIGEWAFRDCVQLAVNGFIIMNNILFKYCGDEKDVVIPDGVESIGDSAFRSNKVITSVKIGNSVRLIGDSAFAECTSLSRVVMGNNVRWIKNAAFNGCKSLKRVAVRGSVYNSAFSGCSSLEQVSILDSGWFDSYAFVDISIERVLLFDGVPDRAFGSASFVPYVTDEWTGGSSVCGTAVVTGKTIRIEFDSNGGEGSMESQLVFANFPQQLYLNEMSMTGFAFAGWSTSVDGEVVYDDGGEITATAPVKLYATWEPQEYTISFDANGGTASSESVVREYKAAVGTLPTATRKGYTFQGWYAAASGGTKISESTLTLGDITYYAQWTPNKYKVTFDGNGGAGGGRWEQECDSELFAPSVARTGYTFTGWLPSVDAIVPPSNVVYKAQWEIGKYTAAFNGNGGTVSSASITSNYNTAIGTLPTATRAGYAFDGWYTAASGGTKISASTKVTEDVSYYAHWSAAIVPAVAEGCEDMGKVSGGGVVASGKTATIKATAAKGYVFAGWYDADGEKLSGEYRNPSYQYLSEGEPVQLYAKFALSSEDATISINLDDSYSAEDDRSFSLDVGSNVTSLSLPKMTVTGLPSGIKFDSKSNTISGTAAKPGVYNVTVKATNASVAAKNAKTAGFTIVVPNFETDKIQELDPATDRYSFVAGVPFDGTEIAPVAAEGYTLSVSGLPSGLKYNSKTGKITGTPTAKAGSYTVTFTATPSAALKKQGAVAEKATITVTVTYPTLTLAVEVYDEAGELLPAADYPAFYKLFKVTGAGSHAANKSVSLGATAAKEHVFGGWHDANGMPLANGAQDFRTSSGYKWTTAATDETLVARFFHREFDATTFAIDLEDVYKAGADGSFDLFLDDFIDSRSLPTLTVSGLPSGLKYDAKSLAISGTCTKPGVYAVTVKATNASIKKATADTTSTFELVVPNIQSAHLALQYDAPYGLTAGIAEEGVFTLSPTGGWSVSAVSGLPAGLSWSKATGVVSGRPTKAGTFTVTIALKNGRQSETATVTVRVDPLPAWVVGTFYGWQDCFGLNGSAGAAQFWEDPDASPNVRWECPALWEITIASDGKVKMLYRDGGGSATESTRLCRDAQGNYGFEEIWHTYSGGWDLGYDWKVEKLEGLDLGFVSGKWRGIDGDSDANITYVAAYQNAYASKPANLPLPAFAKANASRNVLVSAQSGRFSWRQENGILTLTFGANGAVTPKWSGVSSYTMLAAHLIPYGVEGNVVYAKLPIYGYVRSREDSGFGLVYDLAIPCDANGNAKAAEIELELEKVIIDE